MAYTDVLLQSDLPNQQREVFSAYLRALAAPTAIFQQWYYNWSQPNARPGSIITKNIKLRGTAKPEQLPVNDDPVAGKVAEYDVSIHMHTYGYPIGMAKEVDFTALDGPMLPFIQDELSFNHQITAEWLARAPFWALTHPYRYYAGGATSRATLNDSCVPTDAHFKYARRLFGNWHVPPTDGQAQFTCVLHPDVQLQMIASGSIFESLAIYAGQMEFLYKGEFGRIWGVRCINSPEAILRNGAGTATAAQTTFAANAATGEDEIEVVDASPFAIGDTPTLSDAAVPLGAANDEEIVTIENIVGTTIHLAEPLVNDHLIGDFCTVDADVYPLTFFAGGTDEQTCVGGRMVGEDFSVGVSLPQGKMGRFRYGFWYCTEGRIVTRKRHLIVIDTCLPKPVAP